MKYLIDTNIWSYIADTDSLSDMLRAVRRKQFQFVIAPASIFEARRLTEPRIRKKLLQVMTNQRWTRLMPDTFLEAEEIKDALLLARPEWKNLTPNDRDFIRGRYYFRRSQGGFWDDSRDERPLPVTDESLREQIENELAKQEVKFIRDRFKNGDQCDAAIHLQKVTLDVEAPRAGMHTVDYWREATAFHLEKELQIYASPYREWLDCFLDVDAIFYDREDFEIVWFREIRVDQLKRQWLRASMEYLQRWHKPTTGSPADSQLSVHLLDADYLVTADKNFARCVEKMHSEAPFETAQPLKVSAGRNGVIEMIEFAESQTNGRSA